MKQFLLRWLLNFLGLWAAAAILQNSISYNQSIRVLIFAALIFSIVNTFIRPLVVIMTLPAILLTLGLFTFVINAFMLYLVTIFYPTFHIASFWSALGAVFIIWLVNYLLNDLLEPKHEESI